MDYKIPEPSDDGLAEVREPGVAYAVGGGAVKPWAAADFSDDGDDFDDGSMDAEAWLNDALKHPEFVEYLQRSVAKCDADVEAGRTYSHEEVWAEFEREYPQWYIHRVFSTRQDWRVLLR